jgi:type I restriction enzyme S subunit
METNSLFKIVSYSTINSWDVKNFLKKSSSFNTNISLVLFGEFLSKANIKKVNIDDNQTYKILGVRSYGKGAFINREVQGETLKMRVYQQAEPNHLFWCKVDTKNGAFGIINEDLANGLGSSNMTFAKIDTSKANVEFVQLYFKSNRVYEYLDGFVTGTTNRKYIRPDQLLNEIYIPLPTLSEQNRIVNAYNSKLYLAEQQLREVKELEEGIEKYLFEELGIIKAEERKLNSFLQFIRYNKISVWGLDKIFNSIELKSTLYDMTSFEINPSLAKSVFRGKSPKYSENSTKLILNQKCNRWNIIEIEHAKTVEERWFDSIDKNFFTKEGDIIINSTGEGTIGRATCLTNEYEGLLYDSHMLLLRVNKSEIDPLFYTYLFNSHFGQNQVDGIKSAQSTKQTELGVNNLKKIIFPLVPIEKQLEISEKIKLMKLQIIQLKNSSIKNTEEAILEFENEIF